MGREVRMVPAGWEHPVDENGEFIPLLTGSFSEELAEWQEGKRQWEKGLDSVVACLQWRFCSKRGL